MSKIHLICWFILVTSLCSTQPGFSQPPDFTWTYTYVKSTRAQKDQLRRYVEKNWFAMDSVALRQGLINSYQLIENTNPDGEWDFIVAVEYYTEGTYDDIAETFEIIRSKHKIQLVDGLGWKEIGRVVKTEVVRRVAHASKSERE